MSYRFPLLIVASLLIALPAFATPKDYYRDVDGDGYGDDTIKVTVASAPAGYVDKGGDCMPKNPSVNPGVTENADLAGDGIDNDCDGSDLGLPVIAKDALAKYKSQNSGLTTLGIQRTYLYAMMTDGVTVNDTDGTFDVDQTAHAGKMLCNVSVRSANLPLQMATEQQCEQTAGLMRRGSGSGVMSSKKLKEELAARDTRLDTLEATVTTYGTDIGQMQAEIEILQSNAVEMAEAIEDNTATNDAQDQSLREILGYTVVNSDGDVVERHKGLIQEEREIRARKDSSMQNQIDDRGLSVMASVGGIGAYNRAYESAKTGNLARESLYGGGTLGGAVIGRGGYNHFGVFGDVALVSDGSAFNLGMEYTHALDTEQILRVGGFIGGGSHESGGKPPVKSNVLGRYGLIGFEGVAAIPNDTLAGGEVVLRIGGGLESFGTLYTTDEDKTKANQRFGGVAMIQLQVRGGLSY